MHKSEKEYFVQPAPKTARFSLCLSFLFSLRLLATLVIHTCSDFSTHLSLTNRSNPTERKIFLHYLIKFNVPYISTLQNILWWCYSSDKVITRRLHCWKSDLAQSQGWQICKMESKQKSRDQNLLISNCLIYNACKVL